jgi:hypothetical protein
VVVVGGAVEVSWLVAVVRRSGQSQMHGDGLVASDRPCAEQTAQLDEQVAQPWGPLGGWSWIPSRMEGHGGHLSDTCPERDRPRLCARSVGPRPPPARVRRCRVSAAPLTPEPARQAIAGGIMLAGLEADPLGDDPAVPPVPLAGSQLVPPPLPQGLAGRIHAWLGGPTAPSHAHGNQPARSPGASVSEHNASRCADAQRLRCRERRD